MKIRPLFKSDLEQMLLIEKAVHIAPWNEETFKTCFQVGYIGWTIEDKEKLLGFIIISLSVDECHVLNLCVAREYQHQGLGRQLMEYALAQARERGAGIVYLEVRRSNSRAISLYKKMKFHLIGERKDYYPTVNGQEDALIFGKSLVQLEF